MARLIRFETPRAFYNHNEEHMEAHYYVYMHALNYIDILSRREAVVHNAFNIVDDAGHLVIGLHVSFNFFIYSSGWTPEMVEILAGEVPFERFTSPFHFLGQRDLLLELFARTSRKWHIYKERLVYECAAVNPSVKRAGVVVENAAFADVEELVELTLAFGREEFPERPEDVEIAYGRVVHGIQEKKMYVAKHQDAICCILQVLYHGEYNKPIIGSLYTVPEARNKGYATLLVRTVTEGLLKNGYEVCGLLSDMTNPASNKAFMNVGYQPVYHWLDIVVD